MTIIEKRSAWTINCPDCDRDERRGEHPCKTCNGRGSVQVVIGTTLVEEARIIDLSIKMKTFLANEIQMNRLSKYQSDVIRNWIKELEP